MTYGALGLLGLAVVFPLALGGVWLYLSGRSQQLATAQRSAVDPRDERRLSPAAVLEARMLSTAYGQALRRRLGVSGAPFGVVAFTLIAAGAALAGYALASLLLPPWLSVVIAAAAVRGCWAWLDHRREKRRQAFVAQLPELARVLSNGASAGLAITGAFQLAASELDEPARSELRLTLEQMRIGQPLDEAMAKVSERMPSRELGVLITTLAIQQRLGGDVVSTLQDMSDTLEARKDLIREVRTIMSGAVYTAWLVAAIGLAAVLLMDVISPGVLSKLASRPIGIVALVITSVLYTVGFVLVRRVTRVEI